MPRTVERIPALPGVQLPPALAAKLAPLIAHACVEQLLDVASDLEARPYALPLFAAHVRRIAIALSDVRAAVREKLGPPHVSRLPDEAVARALNPLWRTRAVALTSCGDPIVRYAITAAGLDALTDPEANDVADECPGTLPLDLDAESPRYSRVCMACCATGAYCGRRHAASSVLERLERSGE